jgi:hypothetical protein
VDDSDGFHRRQALRVQRAQQPVLAVRDLVRKLLERVEDAVVLDEPHDVPADPACDHRQPLRLPLGERLVPREVEEVRASRPRYELEAKSGHSSSPSSRSA